MVALAAVAGVVRLWNLSAPSLRLRFYLLPIISPLLTPLIYPCLYPGWGGLGFRAMALLDSDLWLELRPWGQPPLAYLLLVVMGLSSALFLLQEMLPSLEWRRRRPPCQPSPAEASLVKTAISRLPTARPNPSISLNDSGQPLACIWGVRQPRLVLSLPLLKTEVRGEPVPQVMLHFQGRGERGSAWLTITQFMSAQNNLPPEVLAPHLLTGQRVDIGQIRGVMAVEEDSSRIYWQAADRHVLVRSSLPPDELLRIARSLR